MSLVDQALSIFRDGCLFLHRTRQVNTKMNIIIYISVGLCSYLQLALDHRDLRVVLQVKMVALVVDGFDPNAYKASEERKEES
jgi:hypothetical protein